jgi:hypothetical protein
VCGVVSGQQRVEGARRAGSVAVGSAPLKARERDIERVLKVKGKHKCLRIPGAVVCISIMDLLGLSSNSRARDACVSCEKIHYLLPRE